MNKEIMTICYVIRGNQILLGLKKINTGQGLFNGFGGHVEKGETVRQAAIRELQEESGLEALTIKKCGLSLVAEDNKPISELHFFLATEYQNDPQTTEEMDPQWFFLNQIPYDRMWPTDRYILPLFINFEKNISYFHLSPNSQRILEYEVQPVSQLPSYLALQMFSQPIIL